MRLACAIGVLCLMAAPVMAGPVTYTFDVTQGIVDLESTVGNTAAGMGGTFAVTIYQSDCHIGESDTIIMADAGLVNSSSLVLSIAGLATATLDPGSARFLDFAQAAPAHIGPGGIATLDSDLYVEITAVVTGAFNTTFSTSTWAGTLLPFTLAITTSVERSDIVSATLGLAFPYEIGIPDLVMTITLDLITSVEGTAHVVPDPAFGGLTAMGLVGAAAWRRL